MEFARRFWALVIDVGYLMDEDGFFERKKSVVMIEGSSFCFGVLRTFPQGSLSISLRLYHRIFYRVSVIEGRFMRNVSKCVCTVGLIQCDVKGLRLFIHTRSTTNVKDYWFLNEG